MCSQFVDCPPALLSMSCETATFFATSPPVVAGFCGTSCATAQTANAIPAANAIPLKRSRVSFFMRASFLVAGTSDRVCTEGMRAR